MSARQVVLKEHVLLKCFYEGPISFSEVARSISALENRSVTEYVREQRLRQLKERPVILSVQQVVSPSGSHFNGSAKGGDYCEEICVVCASNYDFRLLVSCFSALPTSSIALGDASKICRSMSAEGSPPAGTRSSRDESTNPSSWTWAPGIMPEDSRAEPSMFSRIARRTAPEALASTPRAPTMPHR